jgi:hypothetical protein
MSTTVVVVSKGYDIVTGRMKGSTPTQAEPLFMGWGTGGAASAYTAAVSDIGPFFEGPTGDYSTRITGTSSIVTVTTANDTYQVTGTITASTAETIAEMFLSDSSTKAPSTTVASGSTVIGSTSATGLNVASHTGFPGSGNYYIQTDTEVLEVTAGQGTTSWTVVRAQNGSSPYGSIAIGDVVTAGNIPGSTTITGGSLFVHASFTGLSLNSADSITGTFKITVS